MVKFLLDAGASHEHRTDEMHTALMEAAMEGHVEVARLLLDHGANVNIPQDSFESPLTLAACGGHTELVTLLIGYEADIEEVNDEGYTPLMEAAREGHEDTVAALLAAGQFFVFGYFLCFYRPDLSWSYVCDLVYMLCAHLCHWCGVLPPRVLFSRHVITYMHICVCAQVNMRVDHLEIDFSSLDVHCVLMILEGSFIVEYW